MIIIEPTTPRWIQELERFVQIKNLLFVHGNILDLVSYPIQRDDNSSYWTETNIEQFFYRYFSGLGYEIIGHYDPLDGLHFQTVEMEKEYTDSLKKKINPLPRNNRQLNAENVMSDIAITMSNREVPAVFIIHLSSRLLSSPDNLSLQERHLFTRILKATMNAREVRRSEQRWNNVLILVCDKLNDLPAFLYVNNPRSRSIAIDKPDNIERTRFLQCSYKGFYKALTPDKDCINQFSLLTEDFAYYELLSLMALSQHEKVPITEISSLCERYKYGIKQSAWNKLDKHRLNKANDFIRQRIKGQDGAVKRVLEIIKRAKLGLSAGSKHNQRPRGVLFFAGPTGVGKTELAKSVAELLFGHEDRLIRFDMSEYGAPHSDQKLLGSPPGYLGYEGGGQLTNAIKNRPFSVLLFDEIEKAHASIFDKFLQILDDGRLTDNKGETVYFSECLIIFTSNLGTVSQGEGLEPRRLISKDMLFTEVKDTILNNIRDHFNITLGRPEILNRFGDNFIVFDFIRPPLHEEIVDLLLTDFAKKIENERRIKLNYSLHFKTQINTLAIKSLNHGGRGIRNILDSALVNPLATWLFDHDILFDATLELKRLIDKGEDKSHRFALQLHHVDQLS